MAQEAHTYGPACLLHTGSNLFTRRASELSDIAPKLKAHFFYNSALPIDDPLSPLPPPSTTSSAAASKVPPQPFSSYDNAALEKAWQTLLGPDNVTLRVKDTTKEGTANRSKEDQSRKHTAEGTAGSEPKTDHLTQIIKDVQKKGLTKTKRGDVDGKSTTGIRSSLSTNRSSDTKRETMLEITSINGKNLPSPSFNNDGQLLTDNPVHDEADEFRPSECQTESAIQTGEVYNTQYGSSPAAHDTTGTPFLRAPIRDERPMSPIGNRSPGQVDGVDAADEEVHSPSHTTKPVFQRFRSDHSDSCKAASESSKKPESPLYGLSFQRKEKKIEKAEKVSVPVGLSRLHLVEMPELQMKPIYWNPVHDVCSVVRGTWFYKDTLFPVETDIANLLEIGYELFRPWSATYTDEVNSCLEIGPEAELKIVHNLWQIEESRDSQSRPGTSKSNVTLMKSKSEQLKPDERARKHAIETAASTVNRAAGALEGRDSHEELTRLYAKSGVIYANARDAQILRPSQFPSAARGRKPLGPIRKGRPIGIPVVRGFDYQAWEKLHPPKRARAVSNALAGAAVSQTDAAFTFGRDVCSACKAEESRPIASDLVLVIHGIGQKLSERVESFHFTHSINNFRRQMNVELESEAVRPWVRNDFGVMVLPINWRANLSLEEAGAPLNSNSNKSSSNTEFTLKDITADTIPAVRNLISDVMLDIPYYLSHHKPKMIEAVVKEANKVYQLWCHNNPDFIQKGGRVHIIAHSLGSVMALDILSKQPTFLPKQRDIKSKKTQISTFDFDTTNLFFCGSPAGFFLLLNRANLLPRRGRNKPGADGDDTATRITGEAGTFGCLAVDNVYNIMHYNDPIAYRVNACVDVPYATSLQSGVVPSASSTWLQSIGSVFRSKSIIPGGSSLDTFSARPAIAKLPSTIEMETHNFTEEEIAEKKMYLLNDNGQIDYFLSSGGGPLEIQYLNMLSAHSSYWVLQDFVRFLVVEIGRKPGKEETLLAMRAVKKSRGVA